MHCQLRLSCLCKHILQSVDTEKQNLLLEVSALKEDNSQMQAEIKAMHKAQR